MIYFIFLSIARSMPHPHRQIHQSKKSIQRGAVDSVDSGGPGGPGDDRGGVGGVKI